MARTEYAVTGMSCGGCEETVESALSKLPGVNRVDADHEADAVEVVADESLDDDAVAEAVSSAGYEFAG